MTVIIPARNEATNIGPCVESILGSDYPGLEIIVVDDRSTDGTAAVVRKIATRNSTVRLIEGADLPKGWFGKPWACWQGFEAAAGKVLCFTDADTRHGPRLLSLAVAALERDKLDMVTVMPRQEMRGFWERVVQPFFFLLLGLRFGSLRRINSNRNPRHAIANGQFIMVTRDSYEWTGGHRKVAGTVIEDLMLARLYLQNGRRILMALADLDMTTRMYTSLRQIIEGWSKNFFRGVVETTGHVWLAYLAAAAALWIPFLFLLPFAAAALWGVFRFEALLGFGAAAYLGNTMLIGSILRASRAPRLMAIFHPFGALAQAWIFIRAIARGTRVVEWKGRRYSGGGSAS